MHSAIPWGPRASLQVGPQLEARGEAIDEHVAWADGNGGGDHLEGTGCGLNRAAQHAPPLKHDLPHRAERIK